jgi:outer membrane protein TolC
VLLFQAEQAYWSASLARDVLESARASLERARKLVESTEKKVSLNLSENSDLLQVQAGAKLRELNLRLAEQDLATAERSLDTWRGRTGAGAHEELEHINEKLDGFGRPAQGAGLEKAAVPAPAPSATRLDVQAAELALAGAEAGARETLYRGLPDVNAFATVTLNGHDPAAGGASGDALDGTHPTYTVGAALIAPLDFGRLRRVRSGHEAQERAAQREAERARLESAQDWGQLQAHWQDVEAKLALTREIETLQQQKFQAESERFNEGRTTTFQLLTFEEDYSQARVSRLRLGFERLLLEAQARLYNAQ